MGNLPKALEVASVRSYITERDNAESRLLMSARPRDIGNGTTGHGHMAVIKRDCAPLSSS